MAPTISCWMWIPNQDTVFWHSTQPVSALKLNVSVWSGLILPRGNPSKRKSRIVAFMIPAGRNTPEANWDFHPVSHCLSMFSRSVHSTAILGPSVDYTIVSVYFTYLTARPRPDDVTFVSAGYAVAQSCENHLVSYRNYMEVIINATRGCCSYTSFSLLALTLLAMLARSPGRARE